MFSRLEIHRHHAAFKDLRTHQFETPVTIEVGEQFPSAASGCRANVHPVQIDQIGVDQFPDQRQAAPYDDVLARDLFQFLDRFDCIRRNYFGIRETAPRRIFERVREHDFFKSVEFVGDDFGVAVGAVGLGVIVGVDG